MAGSRAARARALEGLPDGLVARLETTITRLGAQDLPRRASLPGECW
jgi:hypothetical protein